MVQSLKDMRLGAGWGIKGLGCGLLRFGFRLKKPNALHTQPP